MKYPSWLPYPKCWLRSAFTIVGALLTIVITGGIVFVLERVFRVFALIAVFPPPVQMVVATASILLPLFCMSHVRQFCRGLSLAIDKQPLQLRRIPKTQFWWEGFWDLVILGISVIVAGVAIDPSFDAYGDFYLTDAEGTVFFIITGIVMSYLYYLWELFREGAELDRQRQEAKKRQKLAEQEAKRKSKAQKHPNRSSKTKGKSPQPTKPKPPADPIEAELEALRRRMEGRE